MKAHTIILPIDKNVSVLRSKWSLIIPGLAAIITSGLGLMNKEPDDVLYYAHVFLLVAGLGIVLFGYLATNDKLRFAPRITSTKENLIIKPTFFSSRLTFIWDDLSKIELGKFRLIIHFKSGQMIPLRYHTDSDTHQKVVEFFEEKKLSESIEVVYL